MPSERFPPDDPREWLNRTLEEHGISIPPQVRDAARLTDYAVESRYPGLAEPVTEEEYRAATTQAENVVAWAIEQVQPE